MWRNAADIYKLPYDEPATRRRRGVGGAGTEAESTGDG